MTWLDPDTNSVKVELEPISVESGIEKYDVEVKTSNETGAGTDANISLSLIGDKTVEIKLTSEDSVT